MINQQDLFRKLGLILNELNEQYQFLAENPQQLSELELELFHANASFLADHVQIIKKINLNNPQPIPVAPIQEEAKEVEQISTAITDPEEECQLEEVTFNEEPLVEAEIKAEPEIEFEEEPEIESFKDDIFKLDQTPSTFEFILNDHSEHETIAGIPQIDDNQYAHDNFITNETKSFADEKFDFEEKSVDEIFNRPLSEEEERILAQKRKLREKAAEETPITEEDEIGPEPFLVHKVEDAEIVKSDLELEEAPIEPTKINEIEPVEDPTYKPTLNDLLAKSTTGSINASSSTALTDLKQGINLNDKILYIKDLFNGYNLAYAEAIDIANKLPNFEAADNFFKKNYASKNNWAEKQATVDQFYELLNRRFKK